MFGRRPDGRIVKDMDPLIMITPYIMPTRVDAQVFLDFEVKYAPMLNYVVQKQQEGYKISFMEIIIAAFVRIVSQNPELNRFIMNKKLYSRKELCVSLAVVKETENSDDVEESVIKVKFDPKDTIFDVAARIKKEVDLNKKEEVDNITLKLIKLLLQVPGLPNAVIGLTRLLDRYGIMPKFLIDVLPFHTSLFLTNMASIGVERVYHHIYNYGTTSLFLSMGIAKKNLKLNRDGTIKKERVFPFGVTADERVCAGKVYAKFLAEMKQLLANPAILETSPEQVRFDDGSEYSVEKPDLSIIRL